MRARKGRSAVLAAAAALACVSASPSLADAPPEAALTPAARIESSVASFTYQLQQPGNVSAAVYDAEGRILRTLMRGAQQAAGEHTVKWDGLDRHGRPHTGEATIKVLRTPGFKAEYVTSIGTNPDSAPYHAWPGEHRGPSSVAVDDTGTYIASEFTESAPPMIKQSRDGKRRFWQVGNRQIRGLWVGCAALAADGAGTVYVLQSNGYLTPFDAKTGKTQAATRSRNERKHWDPLPPLPEGTKRSHQLYQHYMDGRGSIRGIAGADIAAHGETLVISFEQQNSVRWLSKKDGSVKTAVEVPAPLGVAVSPQQRVYVISNKQVMRVRRSGEVRPVVTSNLSAPRRLTIDSTNGDLLVAEGRDDWRIKRFSEDGSLKRTYGRAGGRRDGAYEPGDFHAITDITADGDGGFYVAENFGVRRIAHFDRAGRLVNEWFGGLEWSPWAEPDPRDPSSVWYATPGWFIRAEVDYDTGAWDVAETYRVNALADGLAYTYKPGHGRLRVGYHDGTRYLVTSAHTQVFRHENETLTPVFITGRSKRGKVRRTPDRRFNYTWDRVVKLAGRGRDANRFQWADANGDGRPQPDEFTFPKRGIPHRGLWVTEDMHLLNVDANITLHNDNTPMVEIQRYAPTWKNGVPRYDPTDHAGHTMDSGSVARIERIDSMIGVGFSGSPRGAYRGKAGNYYAYYTGARHDLHPFYWPARNFGKARLVKWNARGRPLWKIGRAATYGRPSSSPEQRPTGHLQYPTGIVGDTENAIVVGDRIGTQNKVWTKDGLYAGQLFDRRADDGLPERVYSWHFDADHALMDFDNITGGRVIQRDDGTVLFFANGPNNVPVYKIHGWDGWQRYERTITVDEPPHPAAEGHGLRAAYYENAELERAPAASRVDEQVWHGIRGGDRIDGGRDRPLYDWSDGPEPLPEQSRFAVRWTGRIEAPLSEPFVFLTYQRGRVRLWIDGKQRVFGWNGSQQVWKTAPIQLEAGQRYTVQIDYAATSDKPACSLLWESPTQERERIPGEFLYPAEADPVAQPGARPANRRIAASTFAARGKGAESTGRSVRLMKDGSYARYARIDFGDGGPRKFRVRSRAFLGRGNDWHKVAMEVRVGGATGRRIATLKVPPANWPEHPSGTVELEAGVTVPPGVHDVYLVKPRRGGWVAAEWFTFE